MQLTARYKIGMLLVFFFASPWGYTQDTITIYDVSSRTETYTIMPPFVEGRADSTNAFFGTRGVTDMPSAAPVEKIPSSEMSLMQKASAFYTNYNFPFTAVTSIKCGGDVTAAVVGKRMLLLFSYEVYNLTVQKWKDLTNIYPFFNDGSIQFGYQTLTPVRYYAINPKEEYKQQSMALVEVDQDIGSSGGYFGLAYDTSSQAYDSLLVYNLSYPSNQVYYTSYPYTVNGDTLMMKYGHITPYWSYIYHGSHGQHGEYVSPFFDKNYRIRGIRWSLEEVMTIRPMDFYFIKYVTESLSTGNEELNRYKTFSIYPIPASKNITIQLSPLLSPTSLVITNILGQTMATYALEKGKFLNEIEISAFPTGVYFATVIINGNKEVTRFVKE